MNIVRKAVIAGLAIAGLGVTGCESVTAVKEENQHLREIMLKQEKEMETLQAQIEALRLKGEGIDPAELEALEVEIAKRQKQNMIYQRALRQMQGTIALTEQIEDKLQALADELGGERVGNRIMLPCDYFFQSGRYTLMPEGKKKLVKFANALKGDNLTLMIVGHTDNVPVKHAKRYGIKDNRMLSLYRATSVLNALEKAGYPKSLMYPTGWGDLKPIVPNDSKQNRQRNRRVEIYVDVANSGMLNASAITEVSPVVTEEIISTPVATFGVVTDGGPVVADE